METQLFTKVILNCVEKTVYYTRAHLTGTYRNIDEKLRAKLATQQTRGVLKEKIFLFPLNPSSKTISDKLTEATS